MALPDASTKLRIVLDYVPCEACLAQPVEEQDLLCTICARVDRQVAVRVGTRTTILVERPSPPAAPILIPPPAIAALPPPPSAAPRDLVVRFESDPAAPAGSVEVVVAPLPGDAPAALAPPVPPAAAIVAAPIEAEPELDFDDLVSVTAAREEFFDYRKPAHAPPPEPVARPVEREPPAEAPIEDDFVFRPPSATPERAPPIEEVVDEMVPVEEVRVEPPAQEPEPWAPPPDFLADEAPPPEVEDIVEMELVPEEEEAILEMEVLPDEPAPVDEEPIYEMELVPDEPAAQPAPAPIAGVGDLHRLRGMDPAAEAALAGARIVEIAHLSGHDAGELAQRASLSFERVQAWIHVADLVVEVGVPLEAALALVAAGIRGPRGLADADADEVADRASAFGGATVSARDVRRWKRRA